MTEFVGVTSDITDRKRSEAHLKLMINELNHRVKNSLATVQSIAVQTFREHQDGRAARDAFIGRLMALSRVHDVLTRENWEGAGLREVAEDATRAFQSNDAQRIELDGPEVRLSPKVALSLVAGVERTRHQRGQIRRPVQHRRAGAGRLGRGRSRP